MCANYFLFYLFVIFLLSRTQVVYFYKCIRINCLFYHFLLKIDEVAIDPTHFVGIGSDPFSTNLAYILYVRSLQIRVWTKSMAHGDKHQIISDVYI
jgi:hypothetical protein